MTHGSLFSGIGGFDLAAEWMGWENVFHCEINPFGRKVLSYYWPESIIYEDITKTDFTIHRGRIDILTGGFPCQPFSMAGKRKGTEDDRHLWPEMLRAIREIQPRYIVGENVPGLINWDGGVVFDEVQADMENEGYEVTPFVLPACGVNAPHRRDRVWFVAKNTMYSGCLQREFDKEGADIREQRDAGTGDSKRVCLSEGPSADTTGDRRQRGRTRFEIEEGLQQRPESAGELEGRFERLCKESTSADTRNQGREWVQFGRSCDGKERQQNESYEATPEFCEVCNVADTEPTGRERSLRVRKPIRFEPGTWDNWPTVEPTIRGKHDGLSAKLSGITFSKHRNESIKAYGNSVVVQVVYQIFKAIQAYENSI